jgi:enoyl-CoA hydratase
MSTLKIARTDGIAVVTLARPPVNVMDAASLEELAAAFDSLARDPSVAAAILTAEGRAFSAGLDLKTVPHLDLAGQRRLIAALNDSIGRLYAWPKPLVAAINGHAIAGGMVVALCADWRVVADTKLEASLAEIHVGVTFPVAALQAAIGELSPPAARRLVLLGEPLSATEAVQLAVFDELVPAADLQARALDRARRYAALPPQAFATMKRELRATALDRIAVAQAGHDPRYGHWLGEEAKRAAAAALKSAS